MNKIRFWHCTLMIGILVILLFVFIIIVDFNISLSLNGYSEYSLSVGEEYIEEGAVAKIFNKDKSYDIEISGTVDTSRIGKYNVYYKIVFLGNEYICNRVINVVDNIIPEIKLNGASEIKIYVGEEYIEEGVSVSDNYDASSKLDITIHNNVNVNVSGQYEVLYSVSDSSGNKNTIIRRVIVEERKTDMVEVYDYNNPVIKYILDNGYDVSVGYYDLVSGNSFYYRENEIYYGASLIKTLDAIYLYDNNMVTDELKLYINKAISKSDNDAHYYLINYIGKNNLKNYGVNIGAHNTLSGNDSYGNTSVNDQIIYMKKLYSIVKNNDDLKSYFVNDYGNYLKFNDIDVMHKYGYYGTYYHDVGIVLDENPYVIVVLTREAEKDEKEIIKNISKLVYDYHKK